MTLTSYCKKTFQLGLRPLGNLRLLLLLFLYWQSWILFKQFVVETNSLWNRLGAILLHQTVSILEPNII